MRFPHPGGFGGGMFVGLFADIMAGLLFIVCFVIVIGLLVVIVRFLLVTTKAAEIYIAKNSATEEPAVAKPVASPAPGPTPRGTKPKG